MRLVMASMVCAVLLSALVFAENAPAPNTTDLWYLWSNEGKVAGYFHACRTLTNSVSTPVTLMNEFEIQVRGKRLSLKMWTYCRGDRFMSPVKIVSEGKGDDEVGSFTATIARMVDSQAGKLTATRDGRKIEMDIPEQTVTDFALFWIVCMRPFEKDKVFEFNCLEASELNLKKGHELAYLGVEELDVAGKMMKLHKFEETGGGIQPCYYWVNDKRELIRVLMDGRKEFLLTTREKALAALEPAKNE